MILDIDRSHRRADPVCVKYREPRGWISRWWFDRNRGRVCQLCAFARWFS